LSSFDEHMPFTSIPPENLTARRYTKAAFSATFCLQLGHFNSLSLKGYKVGRHARVYTRQATRSKRLITSFFDDCNHEIEIVKPSLETIILAIEA
jgi:hypothetical protein